jgi:hypothetical protein
MAILNIAAAWNAGQLICLTSSSAPASQYIVGDTQSTHLYAVVSYNASSSQPFELYNPWGSDASGWALGTFNGRAVWGQFTADANFLAQNFTFQTIGSGTQGGVDNHTHRRIEAATDLLLARWAVSQS